MWFAFCAGRWDSAPTRRRDSKRGLLEVRTVVVAAVGEREASRVRIQMSFWSDLAGKPSSGHTDKGESSFKPRVRGSNPRAGTLNSDRCVLAPEDWCSVATAFVEMRPVSLKDRGGAGRSRASIPGSGSSEPTILLWSLGSTSLAILVGVLRGQAAWGLPAAAYVADLPLHSGAVRQVPNHAGSSPQTRREDRPDLARHSASAICRRSAG
jgi:hypothetical protein